MLRELINGDHVEEIIKEILDSMHLRGPSDVGAFEKLAYIKKFHYKLLSKYENKLLSLMGLFYKIDAPSSVVEEVYEIYSDAIFHETGARFTPVQASAYYKILADRYFSFSAPTSAGKSFLFRELINSTKGNIVIVVPSRALISEYFNEVLLLVEKDVLVLQNIDDINTDKIIKRIYIITPERGVELFKFSSVFDVDLFLLDEAHISEEPIRGMKFDSFVRRIDNVYPNAKIVFAHPFVENPEAQLIKHRFYELSAAKNYNFHAVGKIFICVDGDEFKYFSPNIECADVEVETDVAYEVLARNGTLLVFISKNKIYNGEFKIEFEKYIGQCAPIDDPDALQIIDSLRDFIGASKYGQEKHSLFLEMMKIGVVIHHGSMPLKARLLIEKFIKLNYAKICFATSTLSQGINMPFDVVWIDNFSRMEPLVLKNLIGRSGRTTMKMSSLDFGYTIVKRSNVETFKARYRESFFIRDSSLLDEEFNKVSDDMKDVVEALKDDGFDDELHITKSQVERLEMSNANAAIKYILDKLLSNGKPITGKQYYDIGEGIRKHIKSSFRDIYVQHLRRTKLTPAEVSVLSTAIPIMLWHIQGRSFSEIVSLRYSFLSERDKRNRIYTAFARKEISVREMRAQLKSIIVRFSQVPRPLPDISIPNISIFSEGTPAAEINFDLVVYDTYDYLDKVISLSLVDPICAALEIYFKNTSDERAKLLSNYIRYGTNDDLDIWLLRYGFGFEDIEWIRGCVEKIDSTKITFNRSINELSPDRRDIILRYI